METKTRLDPNKLLKLAVSILGALSALLLTVFLMAPNGVEEAEPAPLPTPSPEPTPTPTPEPSEAPQLGQGESVYYSFDPNLFVSDERGRIRYAGEDYECLSGIDVSEFQYDIDWQRAAADGVDFAIIRSGYRGYTAGTIKEDPYFRQNIRGAMAAGVSVGVYFFSQATTVGEAKEEAEFVLGQIAGYEITMPVVYDLEILAENYRTYNMSRRSIYKCARAFCEAVRAAGYEPMIYMTKDLGYRKYALRELTDYGFWFAEYYTAYPSFVYDFEMWQYSDTGSVAGINGNVDLDLCLRRKDAAR